MINTLEQLLVINDLIKRGGVLEPLYKSDFTTSLSSVCMILEELCKENGEDILKTIDNMKECAKQVHSVLGKY